VSTRLDSTSSTQKSLAKVAAVVVVPLLVASTVLWGIGANRASAWSTWVGDHCDAVQPANPGIPYFIAAMFVAAAAGVGAIVSFGRRRSPKAAVFGIVVAALFVVGSLASCVVFSINNCNII
jgi:hypothetical protein